MSPSLLTSVASAMVGATGLIVAQIPTETDLGAWSKLGFSGACLAIALILATKTIPSILKTHRETSQSMREGLDKGFSELKTSIEKGDDRVASLLQSTLVKLIEDKRDGR